MLSIGKLSPGRADYYLDTVAKGAEEYYLGSGEAPGRWVGHGAQLLGLTGQVAGTELKHVLGGQDRTGLSLLTRQGPERMPGFDCTFNAPKSITLLFALGSEGIRQHFPARPTLSRPPEMPGLRQVAPLSVSPCPLKPPVSSKPAPVSHQ